MVMFYSLLHRKIDFRTIQRGTIVKNVRWAITDRKAFHLIHQSPVCHVIIVIFRAARVIAHPTTLTRTLERYTIQIPNSLFDKIEFTLSFVAKIV